MAMPLAAVFEKVPEGYIAFIEELPGANTQSATLEEARANLQEAVELVLEANRILAKQVLDGRAAIRYLQRNGCELLREGGNHTFYVNSAKGKASTVPRHREIKDSFAVKICHELEIPGPKTGSWRHPKYCGKPGFRCDVLARCGLGLGFRGARERPSRVMGPPPRETPVGQCRLPRCVT
jgi:predicted RNase H-like HicB family nuclease/predicted RNA binding protein YcfA (HicA-like mRNA interferase family)